MRTTRPEKISVDIRLPLGKASWDIGDHENRTLRLRQLWTDVVFIWVAKF